MKIYYINIYINENLLYQYIYKCYPYITTRSTYFILVCILHTGYRIH